jgi:aminoglycoside phosphotransferase (APT) family kinase protein
VVRGQFPAVSAETVEPLGAGWDFDAFLVDSRWVFRFPRRAENERQLRREVAVLDAIGPSAPVRFPRYVFRGQPCEAFGHQFGGYAILPGKPAMEVPLSESALQRMPRLLGRLVDCVHSFDPQRAAALGLISYEREDTLAASRSGALKDLSALQGRFEPALHARCCAFFEDASRLPQEYAGPLRLLHHDLAAEHILVDPETGNLTGVIDWSDVALGDPALDFAGLWACQGDGFVTETLTWYTHPTDSGLWDRIRYRGVCAAVGTAYYGAKTNGRQYLESGLSWLRRVFAEE